MDIEIIFHQGFRFLDELTTPFSVDFRIIEIFLFIARNLKICREAFQYCHSGRFSRTLEGHNLIKKLLGND